MKETGLERIEQLKKNMREDGDREVHGNTPEDYETWVNVGDDLTTEERNAISREEECKEIGSNNDTSTAFHGLPHQAIECVERAVLALHKRDILKQLKKTLDDGMALKHDKKFTKELRNLLGNPIKRLREAPEPSGHPKRHRGPHAASTTLSGNSATLTHTDAPVASMPSTGPDMDSLAKDNKKL